MKPFLLVCNKKIHKSHFLFFLHVCLQCQPSASAYQCPYVFAFKCCTRSLTQHSRPHTLDHLFSPILVEALQKKTKKLSEMEETRKTQGCKVSGGHEKQRPFCCVCLSVSLKDHSDSTSSQAVCPRHPKSPPTTDISTQSDKKRARPHWAEMGG